MYFANMLNSTLDTCVYAHVHTHTLCSLCFQIFTHFVGARYEQLMINNWIHCLKFNIPGKVYYR